MCVVNVKDDLMNAGAEYVDAEVVRDGNLVASREPEETPRGSTRWKRR